MAKNNFSIKNNFGVIVVILLLVFGVYFFMKDDTTIENGFQSTSGELVRKVPIDGSGSFNVTYYGDKTGSWGAIIVDVVSSNCKFANGKTEYKSVMLGDGYTSQTIKVTGTDCIFSGDYNIIDSSGQGDIIKFGSQDVQ